MADLPINLCAGQAGFGRRRLVSGPRQLSQAVDCFQKSECGIDIGIGRFANRRSIDPCQERVTPVVVDADDARDGIDPMAFHQAQRADFGGKPAP